MTKLHIDFETASTADLRKIGSAAYARHPDTRVLCLGWAFDSEPPMVWLPGMPLPRRIIDHVLFGGMVGGWSLQFEYQIWNNAVWASAPSLEPKQLDDTQARAAYHGLPFSLDDAGAVLKLSFQKDKAGHALMLRMSRPRSQNPTRWWHIEDPAKMRQLVIYCLRDVDVERDIDLKLPPLPDREHEVWLKDFTANGHGIAVDKRLARRLMALAKAAKKDFDAKLNYLTGGKVPATTNTAKLGAFVAIDCGYTIPNLTKQHLKEVLERTDVPPLAREALTLRQSAAKTSAAKLPVILDAAPDGVLRGMLAYYGAQRTGRWAGRLLQPQNLPRGTLKPHEVEQALAVIDADATLEDIELLFGRPLDVVSTLIRSCLVARPGKRLVVADFSQIEARVIAWLAGQHDILKVFESGADVYTHTARAVGSPSRQLGKVLVLACGFGQGHVKFQETARGYGLDLSLDACRAAVDGWRKANSRIVNLWQEYDHTAKMIAQSGGANLFAGHTCKCGFSRRRDMMVIKLPSGRELFYHNIRMEYGELTYDGISQTTKQWGPIRTYGGKIAENITQAVARDVMAQTMLCLPEELDLLLTIHDELICEADLARAPVLVGAMLALMRTPPTWAPDLPVAATGWIGERYRKA